MTLRLLNIIMTALLCQQQMITDIVAVNVALDKNATDCYNTLLSKTMVDGDTNQFRNEILTKTCLRTEAYVEIDFDGTYDVQYVVVYAGNETQPGQLDYFKVQLVDKDNYVKCSEFWGPSVISSQGMRVNCETSYEVYSKVKILSRVDNGLSISEIEVHTLAPPGRKPMIYRGCSNFGMRAALHLNPLHCPKYCLISGLIFFGLKNNKQCLCGDNYDETDELPLGTCDVLCDDGINKCGSEDYVSVYLGSVRLPTYIGCFMVPESSLTSKLQDTMTVATCLHHCDNHNYALLKDGNSCFCYTGSIPSTESPYSSCTTRCSGNSNEFCGGSDYFSVYETCLKRAYRSIECSKLLQCADSYDMYGVCIGDCKEGFLGEYCLGRELPYLGPTTRVTTTITSIIESTEGGVRTSSLTTKISSTTDISKTTSTRVPITVYSRHSLSVSTTIEKEHIPELKCKYSNPCKNKKNTVCIIQNGRVKCICTIGYMRTNELSECEDIDECKFEPCDTRKALCINTNGSYICNCLPGFTKIIVNDICIANTSVGNELVEDPMQNWIMLVYIAPFISMMILFFIICFYSVPGKSESLPSSDAEMRRKGSIAVSMVSTKTK